MDIISHGERGRKGEASPDRLPPGQYLTTEFPVFSAGPTPHIPLEEWRFFIDGAVEQPRTWSWDEFLALPHQRVVTDIHCVTKWSKLDTVWEGVSVDSLLDLVSPQADFVLAHSYDGYTTNLPREDVTGGKAWIAFTFEGKPLEVEHGGPARLLVPHLYLWKSAKWVRGLELRDSNEPGFWEARGYHIYGDPWREQRYTGD